MSEEESPKIIVDDDWKEQVQREKEQLDQEQSEPTDPQMPEASFALLVTTLTTQALSAMGFIADPVTGKAEPNRQMAKHFVDTLGVLQEKTVGNLDDDESQLLSESLHQLRMAFVASPPTAAASPEAAGPASESKIELP